MSDDRKMKEVVIGTQDIDMFTYRNNIQEGYDPIEDCNCSVCEEMYDAGQTPTFCECYDCRESRILQFNFYSGTFDDLITALEDFRSKIISELEYEELFFEKFGVSYVLCGKRLETDAEMKARKKRQEKTLVKKRKQLEKLQKELEALET
jgi:hypothetical protein